MTRAHAVSSLSRVFCGVVFLVHGTPKILNLEGTRMFFENVGIPGSLATPIAIVEVVGGLLLVVGFLTRIVASIFVLEMIAAGLLVHMPSGWDVFQGGYEYNIALILLLVTVIVLGPGPASIDGAIAARRRRNPITSD